MEAHHIVIAGFIVFLLMSEIVRRLTEQPSLRERCEEEIVRLVPDGPLSVDALARLATCTNVVREAKRFVPIVPLAFGRAAQGFRCGGYDVPQGWTVYLALHLNNHDPRVFRDPWRFDPDRFADGRAEHGAHPLAFIPQGAEPATGHRCLGLDYSTLLVQTFMTLLLRGYRWSLPAQDSRSEPQDGPTGAARRPTGSLRAAERLRASRGHAAGYAQSTVTTSTGSDVPRRVTVRGSAIGNRPSAAVARLDRISITFRESSDARRLVHALAREVLADLRRP